LPRLNNMSFSRLPAVVNARWGTRDRESDARWPLRFFGCREIREIRVSRRRIPGSNEIASIAFAFFSREREVVASSFDATRCSDANIQR